MSVNLSPWLWLKSWLSSISFFDIFNFLYFLQSFWYFLVKPTDRKTTSKREESEEMLALLNFVRTEHITKVATG